MSPWKIQIDVWISRERLEFYVHSKCSLEVLRRDWIRSLIVLLQIEDILVADRQFAKELLYDIRQDELASKRTAKSTQNGDSKEEAAQSSNASHPEPTHSAVSSQTEHQDHATNNVSSSATSDVQDKTAGSAEPPLEPEHVDYSSPHRPPVTQAGEIESDQVNRILINNINSFTLDRKQDCSKADSMGTQPDRCSIWTAVI